LFGNFDVPLLDLVKLGSDDILIQGNASVSPSDVFKLLGRNYPFLLQFIDFLFQGYVIKSLVL